MNRNPDQVQFDLRRWRTHLTRAIVRRCPHCGSRGLFDRWVVMRRSCPGCHLTLDRNENDYFLGSYVVNFIVAEFVILIVSLGLVIYTWPEVPWTGIKWGVALLMIPVPIFFYPIAKTLWLAIDLSLRPPIWSDFAGHGENEPHAPVPHDAVALP